MKRNPNKYKEPCAVCERWVKGKACDNDKCPVYKMKVENEKLKAKAERRGKWEEVKITFQDEMPKNYRPDIASMRCSACDRYYNFVYIYGDPRDFVHYCSFCGAKMEADNGEIH